MTKHKTATLEGALLDAAVAMAEGLEWRLFRQFDDTLRCDTAPFFHDHYRPEVEKGYQYGPSWNWEHGGPIIEHERLELRNDASGGWNCMGNGCYGEGPTPLIAAMRAYVSSRFGDEVDLP